MGFILKKVGMGVVAVDSSESLYLVLLELYCYFKFVSEYK